MKKNDGAYLLDILLSAKAIRRYLDGITFEEFKVNEQRQDAVNRRFEIIGQAARRLSPEARAAFPDIPWKLATAMRNVLIHDYDDVEPDIVWETAQEDLPKLIAQLDKHFEKSAPQDDSR